ncbi:hypothetical protein VC83_06119 [Pseudogymnoascus destructans]|uniref:Uncharacterized protein n=1 Tax=Pseudogymnoascus destructans TaxID=655981 RepID=A0A177ACJ8_9PEZI|nr:uncharacterized protein VC83_06119 [Pseudogymnoascus destructans]OAF58904.1 hypothetical protein VC83_06119 [Pseudogymnoascus destructans]
MFDSLPWFLEEEHHALVAAEAALPVVDQPNTTRKRTETQGECWPVQYSHFDDEGDQTQACAWTPRALARRQRKQRTRKATDKAPAGGGTGIFKLGSIIPSVEPTLSPAR